MKNITYHRRHFVYLTLVIWLLAIWTGLHEHYCFDGQEPPLSVHMDLLDDHHEHEGESSHTDADTDPVQSLQAKLIKLDLSVLIVALTFLLAVIATQVRINSDYSDIPPKSFSTLLPPLRAPPVNPA